jgi:hypothetical protein
MALYGRYEMRPAKASRARHEKGPRPVLQPSIARLPTAGRLPTRALGNGPLSAGTTSAGIPSIAGTPLISCSRASAFR